MHVRRHPDPLAGKMLLDVEIGDGCRSLCTGFIQQQQLVALTAQAVPVCDAPTNPDRASFYQTIERWYAVIAPTAVRMHQEEGPPRSFLVAGRKALGRSTSDCHRGEDAVVRCGHVGAGHQACSNA